MVDDFDRHSQLGQLGIGFSFLFQKDIALLDGHQLFGDRALTRYVYRLKLFQYRTQECSLFLCGFHDPDLQRTPRFDENVVGHYCKVDPLKIAKYLSHFRLDGFQRPPRHFPSL